ncbi:hypothetical protein KM043_000849 [Ampulex compressa]|nr:hypothetical protein KM043_000849 [Ampulex compressa]
MRGSDSPTRPPRSPVLDFIVRRATDLERAATVGPVGQRDVPRNLSGGVLEARPSDARDSPDNKNFVSSPYFSWKSLDDTPLPTGPLGPSSKSVYDPFFPAVGVLRSCAYGEYTRWRGQRSSRKDRVGQTLADSLRGGDAGDGERRFAFPAMEGRHSRGVRPPKRQRGVLKGHPFDGLRCNITNSSEGTYLPEPISSSLWHFLRSFVVFFFVAPLRVGGLTSHRLTTASLEDSRNRPSHECI